MNKEQREQKEFLEQQVEWTKEQVRLLDEIEERLIAMKDMATYATREDLSTGERQRLNKQMAKLKKEVDALSVQLQSVIH